MSVSVSLGLGAVRQVSRLISPLTEYYDDGAPGLYDLIRTYVDKIGKRLIGPLDQENRNQEGHQEPHQEISPGTSPWNQPASTCRYAVFHPPPDMKSVARGQVRRPVRRPVDGGGASRIACCSPGPAGSTREEAAHVRCGIGSWGSWGGPVSEYGTLCQGDWATDGAPAAGGRSCCLLRSPGGAGHAENRFYVISTLS